MAHVITEFADYEEHYDEWDSNTGQPGIMLFANAVQVWSVAQGRPTSVQEAAAAFNVDPRLIREAVETHPWMLLVGDLIERDGE